MKSFNFKTITAGGDPAKIIVNTFSDSINNDIIIITKRILTKDYRIAKQCKLHILRKIGNKYYMEDKFSLKLETLLHIIHGLIIDKTNDRISIKSNKGNQRIQGR